MPTYTYRCRKCEHGFEEFHPMTDEKPRKCPECGARAVRVPAGGAGLLFKGSGFYITDYRSKSYQEKAKKESGASGGGGEASGGAGSGGSGGGKGGDGASGGAGSGGGKGGGGASGGAGTGKGGSSRKSGGE